MRIYVHINSVQVATFTSTSGAYTLDGAITVSFLNAGTAVNTTTGFFCFNSDEEGVRESIRAAAADFVVSNYSLDVTSKDVIIL